MLLAIGCLLWMQLAFSQAPSSFSYQAVVRDSLGSLWVNQPLNVRISILQDSVNGPTVYKELHQTSTNTLGLLTLSIGAGSPLIANFNSVNWSQGNKFVAVEISPNGNNFTLMGTMQLLSVPYALFAQRTGNVNGVPQTLARYNSANDLGSSQISDYGNRIAIDLPSTPAAKIHVHDNSLTDILMTNVTTGVQDSDGLRLFTDGTNAGLMQQEMGQLVLGTAGTPRMVIQPDGDIGVGVLNPDARLHVNGQMKITGGNPANGKVLTSDANGLASWQAPTAGPQGPQGVQGVAGPQGLPGSANISGTTNYVVKFNGTTSGTNSLIYDNGTNIGIGTSAPVAPLHLHKSGLISEIRLTNSTTGSSSNDGLIIGAVGNAVAITNKEASLLEFGTNNGTDLSISASGDVGVGTSAPQAKLDVNGQIKIGGGNPGAGKVLTSDANGLATWDILNGSGGTLNEAYNFGGPGAGSTITANDGAVWINGSDGFQVTGELIGSPLSLSGSGTRMFFYPPLGAFRTGKAFGDYWNQDSLGAYSFSAGDGGFAKGYAAATLGSSCSALGSQSIAMGSGSVARSSWSIAMGRLSRADSLHSVAIGFDNEAKNIASVAMGSSNISSGKYATTTGYLNKAQADYSSAHGVYNIANNPYCFVVGRYNDSLLSLNIPNENGHDPLFIVGNGGSTSTRSNAMVVQSSGNVGFNKDLPKSTVDIGGTLGIKMATPGFAAVTVDASATIWYFTSSTNIITLPAPSSITNRTYTLVNRTNFNLPVTQFTELDGTLKTTLSPNSSIDVISNGSLWVRYR